MYRRIVVGLDGTRTAETTLVYAAAYSVELGLSLTMYFSGEAKQ